VCSQLKAAEYSVHGRGVCLTCCYGSTDSAFCPIPK